MLDRIVRQLGIDPIQWRALVTTYLRMDFRAGGGAAPSRGQGKARGHPLRGMALLTAMGGGMFAILAMRIPDVLISATLLTSYGAINTIMLLLVDFTALVVSPDDYAILGSRPVSSRTYFAARLTSILVYIATLSAMLALFPALGYTFWWDLGAAGFAATFAAVLLCNTAATVLVIAAYVVLLGVVHPARLRRAFSYFQLVSMMGFYGAYYLSMQGFRNSVLFELSFSERPWMWANPASWFAALIRLPAGDSPGAVWLAAVAAASLTIACVPLAAGRLSLEYAERLGEITAVAEPARRGRRFRLPGFRSGESRAVALLVAAQFRFDQRFRMAILGIVPLILFYLLLGLDSGALEDPFASGADGGGTALYMAVVFMPMTLQAGLQYSDSWRAAWIFFATPASPARLIVAAKNFVAIWFLGGYLLLLAVIWSVYYERVWHAFFHAAVIGLLAHMLLQVAVMLKPALPFASESRRIERSTGLYTVFFFGSLAASIIPMFLPLVYARPPLTAGVVVLMLAVTAALEYALRLRVAEAIGELEFRA